MLQRILLTLSWILLSLAAFAQAPAAHKLNHYYRQFLDFSDYKGANNSDSAAHYRDLFREAIVSGIKENAPATLDALETLATQEPGLQFHKTTDAQLYSVCWDDQEGGTMRNFEGLYIFHNGTVYATEALYPPQDEFSANANVYALYQVNTTKGKAIYLQFEYVQASSALYSYTVSTLSIEKGKLNRQAKYIKTRSGLQHSIHYGLDWSEQVNRDRGELDIRQGLSYDASLKQFSFPLIQLDGTISTKRIKYRFKGNYFELVG
ncbi:MAG: hypothetical protein EOP54_14480 [Sphingobacteriales bacterium]|nr:MAG: hypothetical protein EOP54_14480 [Sphingobacteriales bacterium]